MSDLETKKENFKKALASLEEFIADYKATPKKSIRGGIIQGFEICWEVGWKTLRAYLIDQGITGMIGAKDVFREAYAYGIIDDEKIWEQSLKDRNLTSHTYDEKTAEKIFSRICNDYLPVFRKLCRFFSEN